MTLRLFYYAHYYTASGGITGKLMDAQDFVRAIKGKPVKCKFANLPHPKGFKLKIEPAHTSAAGLIFSDFALERLRKLKEEGCSLIGVPPSKATIELKTPHLTDKLAAGIVARGDGGLLAQSALRWSEPMKSASGENGPRDPAVLFPYLRIVRPIIPERNYVLIDDVCTSGGHLQAAAAKLTRAGGVVRGAICAARTTHDATDDAFGIFSEELDDWKPD